MIGLAWRQRRSALVKRRIEEFGGRDRRRCARLFVVEAEGERLAVVLDGERAVACFSDLDCRAAHRVGGARGLDLVMTTVIGKRQVLRQCAPFNERQDAAQVFCRRERAMCILAVAWRNREPRVEVGGELRQLCVSIFYVGDTP